MTRTPGIPGARVPEQMSPMDPNNMYIVSDDEMIVGYARALIHQFHKVSPGNRYPVTRTPEMPGVRATECKSLAEHNDL